MAKRGKRQKKDGDGESTPAPPPTVHEVTERFVQGQDIASLGRDVDGPFTADALRSRYKAEGTTVDVDKSFSFKSLVVDDSGGGTFSLFGGGVEVVQCRDVHLHENLSRGGGAGRA